MPESTTFQLLRGRIDLAEPFRSPRGGPRPRPALPVRDPGEHQRVLLAQLENIWRTVARRDPESRDPAASHELVVLRPEPGSQITAESFRDTRHGVRVVAVDDATGTVLLDATYPELPHIRRKIEAFADATKVSPLTGSRRSERAIAPLNEVRLATVEDLMGPLMRRAINDRSLAETDLRWFELSCRGGHRDRGLLLEMSRRQLTRVLSRLERGPYQEFVAPERLLVFVRLNLRDLHNLVSATDCVYELDLAGPPVRDWLMFNDPEFPIRELLEFQITRPASDAPSVVVLDTGVASGHPMLRDAILSKSSVVPGDDSAEDVHGHGTLMAGAVLYDDVGALVDQMRVVATHWLENVKLLRQSAEGSASEEERDFWPVLMQRAVEAAEQSGERRRVYAMAVTANLNDPPAATSWSQAVDQLAYADGRGRLLCVAIGNADVVDRRLAEGYPILNLDQRLLDPAQAVNVLTIGAYSSRTELPPDRNVAGMTCLAPEGGVAPCTRAGVVGSPIKPDVVFEGGNAAWDSHIAYFDIDTLSTLTTSREYTLRPLGTISQTSGATAHAARFAAKVWREHPDFRPETVRALIVHSARWTEQMKRQFPNLDQRLALCGYGVPDLQYATSCALDRATVIVEDASPNAIIEADEIDADRIVKRRVIKFFRFPVPEGVLLERATDGTEVVELRITLSYFAEPSTSRRRERRGLDLAFDIQGPQESEDEFRRRMNKLLRPTRQSMAAAEAYSVAPALQNVSTGEDEGQAGDDDVVAPSARRAPRGFSGQWEIGPQRRGRGTVQSDRLLVPAALLAGPRLVAVYPVLGWWDERRDTEAEEMAFSLVVSLEAPGRDVYTPIQQALEATIAARVELDIPGA